MIDVIFHGTRGSFPTYGPSYIKYGGHTSCVSIITSSHWFILDAGTGLIDAGALSQQYNLKNCHMFLSHLHLDHVMGLPSFAPLWSKDFTLNIYSGISNTEEKINNLIAPPYFPVDWNSAPARKNIIFLTEGKTLTPESNCQVDSIALSHPGGSYGYRLNLNGKIICYVTDTDLPDDLKIHLINFIHGCDLLIFDSTYCNSEYGPVAHFGHSTWQMACDLAKHGQVKSLALFHHDPRHTDDMIDQIESEAKKVFPNTFAARCGQKLSFPE